MWSIKSLLKDIQGT